MKPKTETLKHREAFAFYLGLGPERSIQSVATRYTVSESAVKQWSAAFGWPLRIQEAEAEIGEKAIAKVESDLVKSTTDTLKIARAVKSFIGKRIKESIDANGDWVKGAYKPTYKDAAQWSVIEQHLLKNGEPGPENAIPVQNLLEQHDLTEDKIDRIITERLERVRRYRENRERQKPI